MDAVIDGTMAVNIMGAAAVVEDTLSLIEDISSPIEDILSPAVPENILRHNGVAIKITIRTKNPLTATNNRENVAFQTRKQKYSYLPFLPNIL